MCVPENIHLIKSVHGLHLRCIYFLFQKKNHPKYQHELLLKSLSSYVYLAEQFQHHSFSQQWLNGGGGGREEERVHSFDIITIESLISLLFCKLFFFACMNDCGESVICVNIKYLLVNKCVQVGKHDRVHYKGWLYYTHLPTPAP